MKSFSFDKDAQRVYLSSNYFFSKLVHEYIFNLFERELAHDIALVYR